MKKYFYTTNGSVRGSCGHRHRSLDAAEKCIEKDGSGCRSQGGYTDRSVYARTTDEPWLDLCPTCKCPKCRCEGGES